MIALGNEMLSWSNTGVRPCSMMVLVNLIKPESLPSPLLPSTRLVNSPTMDQLLKQDFQINSNVLYNKLAVHDYLCKTL